MPIIDIVLPTFIVIFIGYIIGRFTRIPVGPIVDISLFVGLPALAISSLVNSKIVLGDALRVWAAALIIPIGCLIAAWLVFKALRQRHSGLYMPISMMNTVNIPFPIIYLAYGNAGLAGATLFYIPNVILMFSLGIYIVAGRGWRHGAKEIFRLPALYAVFLGLAINFLDIRLPELALDTLGFIAMMAVPLVLITLGHNLSHVSMSSIPTTLLASFLRIGVGLGIGLAAAGFLHIGGVYRSVVILDSAMPAAATASILASRYDNEAGLVSSVVLLTTVASLAVIPLLLHMLG
jgi:predicted permease